MHGTQVCKEAAGQWEVCELTVKHQRIHRSATKAIAFRNKDSVIPVLTGVFGLGERQVNF